jgi:poly(hydroxyalkanoate) depolymerase family esterase
MLFKKLTNLWKRDVKRGIKRAMKAQQKQTNTVIKSMLVAATPTAKVRRRSATPAAARSKPKAAPLNQPKSFVESAAPGKWLTSSLSYSLAGGGTSVARMRYWLYLPNHSERPRLPLVVMLHGCGQSATQFAQSTRMNSLAEKKGFAVLYPQRPLAGDPTRCWHWYKKSVQQGDGEVRAIVDIIENVVEEHALDRSRIYIAGISAGAAMASIVALNYPSVIAAVGIHSGAVFGAANSSAQGYAVMQHGTFSLPGNAIRALKAKHDQFPPVPAILIHGQNDSVVRPINMTQLTAQFCELNHTSSPGAERITVINTAKRGGPRSGNAYTVSDFYSGKKLIVKVCEVSGLEHAWSGGDGNVRFSESKGPDASKLMWDFFAKHKRVVSTA